MDRLKRLLRDDSLSVALTTLFVLCIAGQSLVGWRGFDETLRAAGRPAIGWGDYLRTGNFLDGVFSNWQAALLQLAVLISFSSVLRQRGAAHSRKPEDEIGGGDRDVRTAGLNFRRAKTPADWVYAHSLSLAFFAAFVLSFAGHAVFGRMRYAEEQAFRGQPPLSLPAYVVSWDFWTTVLQTWEAEFFAIGFYVIASIFLRQESSPESKPVGAPDAQTGGPNE